MKDTNKDSNKENVKVKLRPNNTKRVSIDCSKGGKTKQSFKDECDINNILKRYEKTGLLPDMIKREPKYGDFADPLTYQESMDLVIHAQQQFEALPAKVRERFGNNPQRFLEFTADKENLPELVKMGLAEEIKPTPEDPTLTQLKEINKNLSKPTKKRQDDDSGA